MQFPIVTNLPPSTLNALVQNWLRTSGYEDPALAKLADQLAAQGAKR